MDCFLLDRLTALLGYEEAGAQGLIAGMNAALQVQAVNVDTTP